MEYTLLAVQYIDSLCTIIAIVYITIYMNTLDFVRKICRDMPDKVTRSTLQMTSTVHHLPTQGLGQQARPIFTSQALKLSL